MEVYESTVTFEGPAELSSEEWVMSGSILKDVKHACDSI